MVLLFNIYPSICPIGRKELCFSFNAAKGQNIIILCVRIYIKIIYKLLEGLFSGQPFNPTGGYKACHLPVSCKSIFVGYGYGV